MSDKLTTVMVVISKSLAFASVLVIPVSMILLDPWQEDAVDFVTRCLVLSAALLIPALVLVFVVAYRRGQGDRSID